MFTITIVAKNELTLADALKEIESDLEGQVKSANWPYTERHGFYYSLEHIDGVDP